MRKKPHTCSPDAPGYNPFEIPWWVILVGILFMAYIIFMANYGLHMQLNSKGHPSETVQ